MAGGSGREIVRLPLGGGSAATALPTGRSIAATCRPCSPMPRNSEPDVALQLGIRVEEFAAHSKASAC